MSYLSFSSQLFTEAVGPKPRSEKVLRALSSNAGDTFFKEIENNQSTAEPYSSFLKRKRQWDQPNKQIYLVNAGAPSSIMTPISSYIQSFLGLPCSPLVVRSVTNGMRFVQEKSVAGCKAMSSHDVLAMLERTSEAQMGAIIVALTSKNIFTELDGLVSNTFSDKGRIGLVSLSKTTELRDIVRLNVRTIVKLFKFVECGWYKCIFNSLNDSLSSSLDIACPGCLRRLKCISNEPLAFDFLQRYSNLYNWYHEFESSDCGEKNWISERFFSISGQELLQKGMTTDLSKTNHVSCTYTPRSTTSNGKDEGGEHKQESSNTPSTSDSTLDPTPEEIRSKLKFLRRRK